MDSGNVAWILASSALVCMMIPALALFYGGMVGSRRILNMMMMCFGGASLVAVLWALFGYSMALMPLAIQPPTVLPSAEENANTQCAMGK